MYTEPETIEIGEVEDPTIEEPTDARAFAHTALDSLGKVDDAVTQLKKGNREFAPCITGPAFTSIAFVASLTLAGRLAPK